ncbi:thyroid receptor-interacting protein 11-like [Elysia marginata]|uniref:Thyroid receptor-interacting protein 11-like n=1 Tax=Elysia marginata TaxID=1093978 RepID=A0AAV4JH04_9GAST|nr:thyroid receptor-interacting protein 11-like [Elysia marginata]
MHYISIYKGQNAGHSSQSQADGADIFDLQHKVKSLEAKLEKKSEELQQQAASLHEHHQNKISTLKTRHQGEITKLQAEIMALEQRLVDARDGTSSSQHSGSTNLPESDRLHASPAESDTLARLDAALKDKKKAEDARAHLESTLDELQREVEHLQTRNETLQSQEAALDEKVRALSASLEESESSRHSLQLDLTEARGELQKQATQSLQDVQKEQEEAMTNAEATLEKLGDGDGPQNLTKEVFATLEQENLMLQEEVLKLKEQQVLLEKAAATASEQRAQLQQKNASLREKLTAFIGEEEEESDDTLDAEFSSKSSHKDESKGTTALHISQAEIEKELKSLKAQLKQQTSDRDIEHGALEDIVSELRTKTQAQEEEIQSLKSELSSSSTANKVESPDKLATLETEIVSLRDEKTELEGAIEELDSQHNEALEQLIKQRDELSAKLAESVAQVASQQVQVQELNELVKQLREQAETSNFEEEQGKLSQSAKEAEIADLKEKLQKGGLVINDLHMDKQELQEELARSREEVASKVAKVKEMREENARLLAENKSSESKLEDIKGRLHDAEEELEQWERRNEEKQVEQMNLGVVKDEECQKLRSQVEALVLEKEQFSQRVLSGLVGDEGSLIGTQDLTSVEDVNLRNILEEEVKVRQQMERDHELIQELKQQVQKLYDNKQVLKKELAELQDFKETTIEKLMNVEGELQDARFQLSSVTAEKDSVQEKLTEREKILEEMKSRLSQLEQENIKADEQAMKLTEQIESQQKHFDSYTKELKQAQEMNAESIHSEHQQLLDAHRELNIEADRLRAVAKEKAEVEVALAAKTQENSELSKQTATLVEELTSVTNHISKLESMCQKKDNEISDLQQRMSQFDTDLNEIEESVSIAEEKHKQEVLEREKSLEEVKAHRDGLERSLSQVSVELEQVVQAKQVLERSLSSQELTSLAVPTPSPSAKDEHTSLMPAQQRSSSFVSVAGEEDLKESVSKLETELLLRNSVIEQLEKDLAVAQDMVQRQEAGISDLNEKTAEDKKLLEKAQEQVSRQQTAIAVMRQTSRDKELLLEEIQMKLSILLPTLSDFQVQKLQNCVRAPVVPALEYQKVKAIEYSKPALEETFEQKENKMVYSDAGNALTIEDVTNVETNIAEDDLDPDVPDQERLDMLKKEIETLRERLKEKDMVIAELQKSNSSLLSLLEKGSGSQGLADQVSAHKLEAEVRGLRSEKEQMVAVMTEKSRENSSLKSEVHRLMEVVAAGHSAITKLQEDHERLQQEQQNPSRSAAGENEEDDMRREALANMARLVRDRETEIEALKQKNQTLLDVLQDGGGNETQQGENSAAQVASLLQEKEQLTQHVTAMTAEREQLVACVTQKHTEAVAYHGEVQRLLGVMNELTVARDKAEADYMALVPSFEDKSQALVSLQSELIRYKEKLSDLEVRHGELLQRSNSLDSNTNRGEGSPELASLEEEIVRLRSSELQLSSSLSQKEEKIHTQSQQIKNLEENIIQRETECAHLRKQVENTKFQLTGLMSEIADVRAERDSLQERITQENSESKSLREKFSMLNSEFKDKDLELSSLREQVSTLTAVVQQGSQGGEEKDNQLARLMRENESLVAQAMQLQQERGYHAAMVEQRTRECHQFQAEINHSREKEVKMNKELQRLREHLIEIEDGYTKEALESEEREKSLRNRLAIAEEQLSSSSSQIELASLESSRQVESLQLQVHQACAQRDAAYSQVSSSQEQVRQLSQSLANLQLVLEQFQREKDIAVAAETERLQSNCQKLKEQVAGQKKELEATRADLADALEGLEAANRLSDQLDHKEEALAALKEEVQLREQALHAAEEEIKKLNSTTEAKVDKTLMHNMVMTWLTSPETKRPEIVNLIGHVLSFSLDDFQKIEAAQNHGGLLSGIFRRQPASTSSSSQNTPTKASGNTSFSQLFVSFLERESSPPPTPVRLPAEAMAAEAQSRQQHQRQPAFNPFTAPLHVTHDGYGKGALGRFGDGISSAGSKQSAPSSHHHPLMSPDSSFASSALFTPVFSTSAARSAESAILKDVLGDSR